MASRRVSRRPAWRSGPLGCRRSCSVIPGARLEDREPAVERLGGQQHNEDQALENLHRRVGKNHAPLDETAGGDDAAKQDRDRRNDERIMPSQERNENTSKAVAGGERSVGAALDRRHFEEASEPSAGAGDRRTSDDQPPDGQSLRQRSAEIAAG